MKKLMFVFSLLLLFLPLYAADEEKILLEVCVRMMAAGVVCFDGYVYLVNADGSLVQAHEMDKENKIILKKCKCDLNKI
jgi:hypothetical protein